MNEEKKKALKKLRKKRKKRCRILCLIFLVVVLILFVSIFYLNIIPLFCSIPVFILTILIGLSLIFLTLSKKKGIRLIGYFLSILIIFGMAFGEVYIFKAIGFIDNITNGDYILSNYNVLVLNNSDYKKLAALKNQDVGISKTSSDDSLNKAKEKITKKVKVNYQTYEDTHSLVNSLSENEIAAIILEDSELALLKDEETEIYKQLKVIKKIEIKSSIKNLQDAVNINKEPFNIYVSGIDTFGKINSASRSDVNMILTVNPEKEKILITWVPRDYYVKINNSTYKDKLTHAGIYGVDSSIYALENLFDIDINYYVKVNFTSLVKVVDLLGGVTIYNDETFRIENGHVYKKGNLTLNGNQALEFVRERKHISGGDLGRGKNQIKVLEALMHQAMSPSILKKYNDLLDSLDNSFLTNMNKTTMLGFIKKEMRSPRNWQIESNVLTGEDSYEYTYSFRKKEVYVMKPSKESVNDAKTKINSLFKEN